eukprot:TRINITY_DN3038_c0_g1_i1.p1 TRINITY_DN3038_c0_g1~~TRINITY_DN3038_c0_g1_i1.p1  ORF type:complete len:691 (+),score=93.39 TRINITY_DN3038_c0_g1_i1:62-2134(+)
MIRRPPRSTLSSSSAASDVYKRQYQRRVHGIIESIKQAKQQCCSIRLGPELEIPGYGCEDHFLEIDTILHSWQILSHILQEDYTDNLLCAFGMPVLHNDVSYNCTVMCLNRKIILIRPKMAMADDGIYRESRYFTAWNAQNQLEQHLLPVFLQNIIHQEEAPFGQALLNTNDSMIGIETCEELWQPFSTHIQLGLEGAEIILNNSASHFELAKFQRRVQLLQEATSKDGGLYVYSNIIGCDGGRMFFDGRPMIMCNGKLIALGQNRIQEVEVVSAVVDLNRVRISRMGLKSRAQQTQDQRLNNIPIINVKFSTAIASMQPMNIIDYQQEEEGEQIAYTTAAWLWDYLRKSKATAFFLPLSGGADSSSTAVLVYCMAKLVFDEIVTKKSEDILAELRRIVSDKNYYPSSIKEIVGKIFCTCYMGTKNSSIETLKQAEAVANEIGSNHFSIKIDDIFDGFKSVANQTFKTDIKFRVQGGSYAEDISLQNIQARSRMVLSYLLAGLVPQNVLHREGFTLVLGSANLDEGMLGYFTKYDCSSADINPIGSYSKVDLKKFLLWAEKNLQLKSIGVVIAAKPTAELTPLDEKTGKFVQTDEEDMGLTYEELSAFGKLRKAFRCGPVSMFKELSMQWKNIDLSVIQEKVKHFFWKYSINRHKMTTITPSMHAQPYSCLLYTSPSPRDRQKSRMPSSA